MKTKYVLITPVHNEMDFIEGLIKAVLSQTILPQKWILVDDASTDGSGELIKKYSQGHDFILYHQLKREDAKAHYARRTQVFCAGYMEIKDLNYDYVGSLDADILLEPTYYESILQEFDKNTEFGIVTGVYADRIGDRLEEVYIDKNHTPGALQLFRRQCYETIGGYLPFTYGGDDTCAEIMVRMNGWKTRSFSKYIVVHCRPVGTGSGKGILRARFYQGLTEYGVATHPLFMIAKSIHRIFVEKPFLVSSLCRLTGFLCGYLRREERAMPSEAKKFVRKEQIKRLFGCPD